jgi:hypothetical protein
MADRIYLMEAILGIGRGGQDSRFRASQEHAAEERAWQVKCEVRPGPGTHKSRAEDSPQAEKPSRAQEPQSDPGGNRPPG